MTHCEKQAKSQPVLTIEILPPFLAAWRTFAVLRSGLAMTWVVFLVMFSVTVAPKVFAQVTVS